MLISHLKDERPKIQFALVIILVLLIGIGSSMFVFFNVKKSLLKSLQSRVLTLTAALPSGSLMELQADESDLDKYDYIYLKNILTKAHEVNDDVRFAYIIGQTQDGNAFFFVDSENPSSSDYSPPGQMYDEASATLLNIFKNGQPAVEGPIHDRWGNWISALAPLKDDETGKVIGVAGMDIAAGYYIETLLLYTGAPLAVSIIVAVFIYAIYRSRKKDFELLMLKSRFISIASHELRAPLAGVRWALEGLMSEEHKFSSEHRDILADVYERSSRMMSTLNNLSDIIALENHLAESLTMVQFDLREAVDEAVARTRFEANKKHVNVNFAPLTTEMLILGDKNHLVRSFVELIRNSLYYSDPEDTVDVNVVVSGHHYTVNIKDKGVNDTRIGIDAIFQNFDKFASIEKNSNYGIGIGLYLARSVLRIHKGKLWFENVRENEVDYIVMHCRFPKLKSVT